MVQKSFSDSVEIGAPSDRVFAFIADPKTGTQWIKGVTKIELIDEPPSRVGMRFRATRSVSGRESTEEISITRYEPNTAVSVGAGLMGGGIVLSIDYRLTPTASGTRVDSTTSGETKSFGSRLIFGMFWRAVTENDAGNLRTLKSILERT